MRFFVTGATGFLGGRLVRQLVANGHRVAALVRHPDRARDLKDLGVAVYQGDITEPESMRPAMEDADGVFHLAAWYRLGARGADQAYRVNVTGTRNVLEMMRDLRIPKGVYTSTLAVFGDTHGELADETWQIPGPWLSEYDRTKWLAHARVALPMITEGLQLVIVQPGLVYGPGDHSAVRNTFRQYLARRLPLLPEGAAYCWAHVEDAARGHILAMERGKPGESYILAGPCHTLAEAMEMAEGITGIPAPKARAAPGLLKALSPLAGLVERLIPLPEAYTGEGLRVAAGATYLGDNTKARRELGYDPRPLEDGLRETLTYEMGQESVDSIQ